MGTNSNIYILVPTWIIMVYHELRIVNGKKQNYLIYNKRENGKWTKKSKFMGIGALTKKEINEFKKKFETELKVEKVRLLSKEQASEIERLKQVYLDKLEKFSTDEFEKFENAFSTELTYNSNAIEGSSLSLAETSLIVNEDITPKGKSLREIYEAKNHVKAIEFIKNYKGDIDELFILKVHSIILKDISEKFAGRYRENPVKVLGSDFKFPIAEKVPQLVGNLVYWYHKNKKEMHPFELAILFSSKLVSIHPFIDGNGRISRLVMNFILYKNKYPRINIYMKQREEYLKAIRKANDEDYLPILEHSIKTLKENLKDFGFID